MHKIIQQQIKELFLNKTNNSHKRLIMNYLRKEIFLLFMEKWSFQ